MGERETVCVYVCACARVRVRACECARVRVCGSLSALAHFVLSWCAAKWQLTKHMRVCPRSNEATQPPWRGVISAKTNTHKFQRNGGNSTLKCAKIPFEGRSSTLFPTISRMPVATVSFCMRPTELSSEECTKIARRISLTGGEAGAMVVSTQTQLPDLSTVRSTVAIHRRKQTRS